MKIKAFKLEKFRNLVRVRGGKYYVVDSCYTIDHGFESIIFRADSDGVTYGTDLYMRWYDTRDEMIQGHNEILNSLPELLEV